MKNQEFLTQMDKIDDRWIEEADAFPPAKKKARVLRAVLISAAILLLALVPLFVFLFSRAPGPDPLPTLDAPTAGPGSTAAAKTPTEPIEAPTGTTASPAPAAPTEPTEAVTATIYLDVNPSFEVQVDKSGDVISFQGINDDGKKLAEDLELTNARAENAIGALVSLIVERGYLTSEQNALLITVDCEDRALAETLSNALRETVDALLAARLPEGKAVFQTLTNRMHLDLLASRFPELSVGKALLILDILARSRDFGARELVSCSISDLCNIRQSLLPVDPASLLSEEDLEKMKGMTLRFLIVGRDVVTGKGLDADLASAIERRNEALEEKLGVKIETVTVDLSEFDRSENAVLETLISKNGCFDIVILPSDSDIGIALTQYYYSNRTHSEYDFNFPFFNLSEGGMSVDPALPALFEKTNYCEVYHSAFLAPYASWTADPAYNGSVGVCYLNEALFDRYADELLSDPSAGGCRSLDELVQKGYWTVDFLLSVERFFSEKEDGTRSVILTPCIDARDQARQIDLLFAGSGIPAAVQDGMRKVKESDFYTATSPAYKTTFGSSLDKRYFDAILEILDGSVGVENRAAAVAAFCGGFEYDGQRVESLLALDALSACKDYMQEGVRVMPLPMKDRAQYDEELPSLGYASTRLSSKGYALLAFPYDHEIRQDYTSMWERSRWVLAATAEMLYLSDAEPFDPAPLSDADREMAMLSKAGVFSDFSRTWCRGEIFEVIALGRGGAFTDLHTGLPVAREALFDYIKNYHQALMDG